MNALVSESHSWTRKVGRPMHGDRAREDGDSPMEWTPIEHGTFSRPDTLLEMKKEARCTWLPDRIPQESWVAEKAQSKSSGHPRRRPREHRRSTVGCSSMQVKIGVPLKWDGLTGRGPHGRNAREFSLMNEGGHTPACADRSGRRSAG